jgi:lipopolysaccharide transport system permease protein
MRHLFALLLQLWMYASPVIYPVTSVPEQFRTLYFLNPMAGILTAYREVLILQQVPGPYFLATTILAVATFLFGYWFFRRVEPRFADVV